MTKLLGFMVRDKLTGLVGIADCYIETLYGLTQYTIQPQGDGKDVSKAYNIDIRSVEPVRSEGDGEPKPIIEPVPAQSAYLVQLGDKVEHILTGQAGIVAARHVFINGCVFFTAVTPVKKDGEPAEPIFAHHSILRTVKPNWFAKLVAKTKDGFGGARIVKVDPPAVPPKPEDRGGPTTLARRL